MNFMIKMLNVLDLLFPPLISNKGIHNKKINVINGSVNLFIYIFNSKIFYLLFFVVHGLNDLCVRAWIVAFSLLICVIEFIGFDRFQRVRKAIPRNLAVVLHEAQNGIFRCLCEVFSYLLISGAFI